MPGARPTGSFQGCPPRGAAPEEPQPVGSLEEGPEQMLASNIASYGTVPERGALSAEIRTLLPQKVGVQLPERDAGEAEEQLARRLRRNWPHYYMLACLALFSAPVTAALHLAEDASVSFWVGDWGFYAVVVPWLLALFHVVNVRVGEPRMIAVICTTVVPAIVLGVIANIHLNLSGEFAHRLIAKDCVTWREKRGLQASWTAAAGLYERCVNRTVAEHGLSLGDGLEVLRLQDCNEYVVQDPDVWAEHRKGWEYLRRLEEEHECAGWCYHAVPLWSFQGTKDACAITAGNVLIQRVDVVASRMLSYSVAVGIVAILGIMLYGREMRRRGFEWSLA
mmetsp:Transcript_102812/g.299883  ORF Transcript_102812/g.299883 Transcript_102812/m.299883 type:complete len:336 (+) Transcript_102812:113-1120(+)